MVHNLDSRSLLWIVPKSYALLYCDACKRNIAGMKNNIGTHQSVHQHFCYLITEKYGIQAGYMEMFSFLAVLLGQ